MGQIERNCYAGNPVKLDGIQSAILRTGGIQFPAKFSQFSVVWTDESDPEAQIRPK